MSESNPTSPKVIASLVGAGGGAAISTLALWALGVFAWGAPGDASAAQDAIAAVPGPVAGFVLLLITTGLTFLAGYRTTDPLRLPTLGGEPEFDPDDLPSDEPVEGAPIEDFPR